MNALFIGRFQPLHNGHLKVIQESSKKYDEIIIGIGSSQYGHALDNPFTGVERKKMINETLKKEGINNYKIILIPDIHNPPKWVDHVLKIISDFDIVISNNSQTLDLFAEKGYKTCKTPLYNEKVFSGQEIRRRIIDDDKWQDLVPNTISDLIIKIKGVNRLKNLE